MATANTVARPFGGIDGGQGVASIHLDLLGTETRFIDTGKYRTRCISAPGTGEALFMLHGGGGHAETYSRNLMRLSKSCSPYAVDFIWHGMSSHPAYSDTGPGTKDHWLSQFTDQILNLMDHLGIEKAAFEGESLGGWIAFDMAINHPDRTSKVILNTSWGMHLDPAKVHEGASDLTALRDTSMNALLNPTRELLRKRLDWLMPLGGVTEELVDLRLALWSIPETRAALVEYYNRLFADNITQFYFNEDDIRKITCPTLVLWTDKNPIHGTDAADRLEEIIPGAQKHIMRGCAHWPQWERPEEHDDVVGAFMRS